MPVTPKAEQVVQAWRERGPDEEPKPTGRARLMCFTAEGKRRRSSWEDDYETCMAFVETGIVERWGCVRYEIEFEYVSRTPGKVIGE